MNPALISRSGLILKSSLVFTAAIITACVTNHVNMGARSPGSTEVIVRRVGYDEKGLPVLGAPLTKRPSRPGDHFTLVRLEGNRPVLSYDIAVVRQKPDFARPFHAVYEWTGKGFMLGLNSTEALAYSSTRIEARNRDEAAFELAVIVTPLAVSTVGGFVVGLVDGIRHTAVELGRTVMKGEEAVTRTVYEYDGLNRLAHMRMFTPDNAQELVVTDFVYEGAGTEPVKTVVTSNAEGKEREIRQ